MTPRALLGGMAMLVACRVSAPDVHSGPIRVAVEIGTTSTFRVTGLSAADVARGVRQPGTASVAVAGADADLPRVAGTWAARGDTLEFLPQYPPAPGLAFTITIDTAALHDRPGGPPVVLGVRVEPPNVDRPPTRVAIYPAADRVPENALRWYLEFTNPMTRGQAGSRVHLVDRATGEVDRAWLDGSEELWSPDGRRLTMLFDPGRVKRGIRTNLESGRPLLAGHRYRIEIDADWPDAAGRPLGPVEPRAFVAVAAVLSGLDPASWALDPPRAGTREPVPLRFRGPMDRVLATQLIKLFDEGGRAVAGAVGIGPGDAAWIFTPCERWSGARYRLEVSPELEDVAGNRPGRPFDREVNAPDTPAQLSRWFVPRPSR